MDFTPNQVQAKWLFELVFTGDEPKKSAFHNAGYRDALERAGLIAYEQRGRARHVVLTDAGWQWVGAHLDAPLGNQQKTNALAAALLRAVAAYLDGADVALADFVTAGRSQAGEEPPPEDVRSRVRQAALDIGGGPVRRVRLAALRERLPDVPRETLDAVLLGMQRDGAIELFRFEDPTEKTPADDAAAMRMAGLPHHIVYLRS